MQKRARFVREAGWTQCDIHAWMKSYAVVNDSPFFAVTGADGTFEIKDLPVGEYTLEAWHPKLGTKTLKISIGKAKADPDAYSRAFRTLLPVDALPSDALSDRQLEVNCAAMIEGLPRIAGLDRGSAKLH